MGKALSGAWPGAVPPLIRGFSQAIAEKKQALHINGLTTAAEKGLVLSPSLYRED